MSMDKVNIAEKLSLFTEHWQPKIVAELNGQYVKVAKLQGAYVWHAHAEEDEAFLVVVGHLRIELRDGAVELGPGELCVIPRGVEHRPVAEEECHCVLFEPASTRNTGAVEDGYTIEADDLERI